MKEKVLTDASVWYEVTNNLTSMMAFDYEIQVSEHTLVMLGYSYTQVKNDQELANLHYAIEMVFHMQEEAIYLQGRPFEYFLKPIMDIKISDKDLDYYVELLADYIEHTYEELQEVPSTPSNIEEILQAHTLQAGIYKKLLFPEGASTTTTSHFSTLAMTKNFAIREMNKVLSYGFNFFPQMHDLPSYSDLYVSCLDALFRYTAIENTPITENDIHLLYNMLYFKGMDYYWTKDPKMKKLMKMAQLDHLLYSEKENYHQKFMKGK
ncbi:hypothetical protein SAMN05216480_105110 [Pustulibacterium marinum]|uniref:Uncharacterized protein n=1 Tax=Pustulibacterium marinum TaxID=1224947 RepID=A0A1I7GN38_9FLAO|nr:hypothetical protein [Pustulibacterium marinum]SFU49912.1 hypothetical protein SAMN05216480_105110 [Pustulibacterium marinum]